MTEIAKKSPAIDFFPPVGEASRTIILANRNIKDEAISTEGIDLKDRKVLADTFSVLENVGLSVVDHLGRWFGNDELTPFRESLNDSKQTKLGLNHLTALARTEEKTDPDKANNETTIKPHYDYGALTILTKGSRDGLEFYYDDKKKPEDSGWVRVKDLPDNIVLAQAGQMLDIVTRGKFSPMLHQVKPSADDKDKDRDSVVLFMQPRETEDLDKLKISSTNQISGFEARFKEFVSNTTGFTSKNFSLFMNFMRRMRAVTEEFKNFFKPDKLQEVIKNYQDHGLNDKVDPAFLRNEAVVSGEK
jgi:hypothetical protein